MDYIYGANINLRVDCNKPTRSRNFLQTGCAVYSKKSAIVHENGRLVGINYGT